MIAFRITLLQNLNMHLTQLNQCMEEVHRNIHVNSEIADIAADRKQRTKS